MALPSYTQLSITNMALRLLGDDPIASAGESTRRAQIANEWFETLRTATLQAHPWREATKITTLYAYTEPAGALTIGASGVTVGATGVVFDVATVTPFTSAMATTPEYRIWRDSGPGKATITGFTDTNTVSCTIDEAFSSDDVTPNTVASGAWRLYTGEPDGLTREWGFIIALPSDSLRVRRISESLGERYARVGDKFYSNSDALQVEYTYDLAVTNWTPLLARAMAYHLAATIGEPLLKSAAKVKVMADMYKTVLDEARAATDQEGTPEEFESNILLDVRYGGTGVSSSLTRDFGAL